MSQPDKSITMSRCPTNGSIHTCACEPRFVDPDAGSDYSCIAPEPVVYVAADAVADAIDRAVDATCDDGKSDMLNAIRANVAALTGEEN